MSIYEKIQQVAVALQQAPLQKSGENKFAGFKYFELGDFLPTVNELFLTHGLCGVCSFNSELATLTVFDNENGDRVDVTSPMVTINMKGANEIQNLGAVETYTRRYLYLALLGIVENDVADATSHDKGSPTPKKEAPKKDAKLTDKQLSLLGKYVNDTNRDAVLKHYHVTTLEELDHNQASALIKHFLEKGKK